MATFKKLFVVLILVVSLFAFSPNVQAAMTVSDNGAFDMLAAYLNASFPPSKTLVLHLYCTSTSITDTVTPSSFTECSGGGYAAINLSNGSWTLTNGNGSSTIPQAAYAQQTFTFTGALTTNGTVYGYYIVDSQTAAGCTAAGAPTACCTGSTAGATCPNVVTAEAFGQTFTPANNGDNIQLTPAIQLSHGTPAY
jgi:hypothetical protein